MSSLFLDILLMLNGHKDRINEVLAILRYTLLKLTKCHDIVIYVIEVILEAFSAKRSCCFIVVECMRSDEVGGMTMV